MISIANIVSSPDEWYRAELGVNQSSMRKVITKPYRLIERDIDGELWRTYIFDIEKDDPRCLDELVLDEVNVPPQDLPRLGPWLDWLSTSTTKIFVRDCLKENLIPGPADIKVTFDGDSVAALGFEHVQRIKFGDGGNLSVLLLSQRGNDELTGNDLLGKQGRLSIIYASEHGTVVTVLDKIVLFEHYTVKCSVTQQPSLYGEYIFRVTGDPE